MGDNFLKRQVRNFKKGRDKALATLSKATLFSAPEVRTRTFPVQEANGYSLALGDVLLAVPSRTPGEIAIVRGTRYVGHVRGDAASPLLDIAEGIGTYVEVESRNDLSGIAHVKVVRREKKNEYGSKAAE